MAATSPRLVFHFPVAAEPTKVLKTLKTLLYTEEPILTSAELDELTFAQNTDTNRFTEARILAENLLGLIETTRTALVLTPSAQIILQKREAIQYDLLHYLFSTAWSSETPTSQTRSWFYRV